MLIKGLNIGVYKITVGTDAYDMEADGPMPMGHLVDGGAMATARDYTDQNFPVTREIPLTKEECEQFYALLAVIHSRLNKKPDEPIFRVDPIKLSGIIVDDKGEWNYIKTGRQDDSPCVEHVWKTHRNPNTPDRPGDIFVYCENCGTEQIEDE